MNLDKPIAEQIPSVDSIKSSISETTNQLASSATELKQSIGSTMGEFSSQKLVSGSQDFLNANGMIAKFAFLIFVLIIFMFTVKVGIQVLGYLMTPSANPYLLKGMVPGNQGLQITQDPANALSVPLSFSNNQTTGIEFTWSMWLLITNTNTIAGSFNNDDNYLHIFNKGNGSYDTTDGLANVNNGPGLYIKKYKSGDATVQVGTISLTVAMDDVVNSAFGNKASPYLVDISGIPINKWFHVALRMENTMLDTYINGTIANRTAFEHTPKQNFYDVFVGQNGGFSGNLSNLQYFSKAISAFEINNIVMYGPNTTPNGLVSNQNSASYPYYMSSSWFQSKM